MHNSEQLILTPPSVPSGGGAISGLKESIAAAGPDGAAALSLPLPVSQGRGYTPSLALSYNSRGGNGPFGVGWDINLPAIRLRTSRGVPAYQGKDEFTGPDGEILVPVLADSGETEVRSATSLLGISLQSSFAVHAWRSRVETDFSRLEHWIPAVGSEPDFWVMYQSDGQIHLFGRNSQARVSDPDDVSRTAVWLRESSVSLSGEQICYQYRAEDEAGCPEPEKAAHSGATAQRYLVAAFWGNKTAGRRLPALTGPADSSDWLFMMTLDYAERKESQTDIPLWQQPETGNWTCREDCFSRREYGFEVRTRRLCHGILLFHCLKTLAGAQEENEVPELITWLQLKYNQSPMVTTLASVRQVAGEQGAALCALPPLTFDWQIFSPLTDGQATWHLREDMAGFNLLQPYQLVDLNGEGIAGILYQDKGAWWYRSPERLTGSDPDAVTWGKPVSLPSIPALRGEGILADFNGDGYLEWLVTAQGAAGRYERTPERQWRRFTPLSVLPTEITHARALLTDLTGAGLADVALIGPRSVSFYRGDGDGWQKAQTVMQSAGITLPVPGTDRRVLVAFSDIDGSGQQHLTEVRADGVRYWPNLGHGRFGQAVSLPGFSQPADTFNPERLFFADIDGSGTADLIYAQSDRLDVYSNLSGNLFAAPFSINLPEGVRYDRTCSLQLADIQGLGKASLVLTVTHPAPRSWVCQFSADKPWLLKTMNNNMGARHVLHYRSSAQFWLDEKAQTASAGKAPPVCHLPFIIHVLSGTSVTDEITGNCLTSTLSYRHGGWDGREREFRGFGFIEARDMDNVDITTRRGVADESGIPAVSRSWYATGIPAIDDALAQEYWQGDAAGFQGYKARFTTGSSDSERSLPANDDASFWLNRGMKGMPLRSETFGADGSEQASVPYTVTEHRPQIRLVQRAGRYPVVWPAVSESRTSVYERISSDPQCSQQVLLTSDEHGQPLKQVAISWPRRSQPPENPYPASLPDGLASSARDDQQHILRLTLQQSSWHLMSDIPNGIWLTGVSDAVRSDAFLLQAAEARPEKLTPEALLAADNLLVDENAPRLLGQRRDWYLDNEGKPATSGPVFPPRRAFSEAAVLDSITIDALPGDFNAETLSKAGYILSDYLFERSTEAGKQLWSARQEYITWGSAEHFWLPVSYRGTLLSGSITLSRDRYDCVVTRVQDAAGLTTMAEYDWRFLVPVRVTDVNDNEHSATLDALGRVTTLRVRGTENGKPAGYSSASFSPPTGAGDALALTSPLPVAKCYIYITDSWQQHDRLPPHVVVLTTDRYDCDKAQQIRQQVIFSDGFARTLQISNRRTDGEAMQRAADGSLIAGKDGLPVTENTPFRWAVSGRTEYDNKGQPIRTYQPYFLNTWKYVSDDSCRKDLYADTHSYDAMGRELQVRTAKGWLRRTLFTPWFVVSEDENDTADESGTGE